MMRETLCERRALKTVAIGSSLSGGRTVVPPVRDVTTTTMEFYGDLMRDSEQPVRSVCGIPTLRALGTAGGPSTVAGHTDGRM